MNRQARQSRRQKCSRRRIRRSHLVNSSHIQRQEPKMSARRLSSVSKRDRQLELRELSTDCARQSPKNRCCNALSQSDKKTRLFCQYSLIVFAVLQKVSGMIFAAVYVVLTFSPSKITDELQNPLPIYLSSILLILSGLCNMVISKVHNSYMTLTGIFFNISSCVVTLTGSMSVGTVVLPKLTSYIHFQYFSKLKLCIAFTRWDVQPNGSYMGGVQFEDLPSCSLIESTLPPLALTLAIFYGISCLTAFVSCFVLALKLCWPKTKKKSRRSQRENESSYVNYAIGLDNLCEIDDQRLNLPVVPVKAHRGDSEFIPGNQKQIPYLTLPYRLRVEQPNNVMTPARTSVPCQYASNAFTRNAEISACSCYVVNALGEARESVISSSVQPPTISATVRPHNLNIRPMLPAEFQAVSRNCRAESPRRNIRTTDEPGCSSQINSARQTGVNQLQQNDDRPRRLRSIQRCIQRENGSETRRQESPRRRNNYSARIERSQSGQELLGERSSTSRRSAPSPPPYSELPTYREVLGDSDQVYECESTIEGN